MFEIHATPQKNRLYVTVRGKMDIAELQAATNKIKEEARRLKSGFGVVSDIQEFIPLTEEVRQAMQNTMKVIRDAGMGHVVRISTNAVVANQWQRTSRTAGYEALEAPNQAEAEKILDNLEKVH